MNSLTNRRNALKHTLATCVSLLTGIGCAKQRQQTDEPTPPELKFQSQRPESIFSRLHTPVIFTTDGNVRQVSLPVEIWAKGLVSYTVSVKDPDALNVEAGADDDLFMTPLNSDLTWTTVKVTGFAAGLTATTEITVHFNQVMVQNSSSLSLYCDKMSYQPGEHISVHVSSDSPAFDLDIFRLDGNAQQSIWSESEVRGMRQNYRRSASSTGAAWHSSALIPVDSAWTSGIYVVRVSVGRTERSFPVVIRDLPDRQAPVVFLASTNTWNAYNSWGGASAYRYYLEDGTSKAAESILSYQRPLSIAIDNREDHLVGGEIEILNWLHTNGIKFSVISDSDLHHENVLAKAKVLVTGPHPEYWSENMRDRLDSFLDSGGSLAYLGANGLYKRVDINDRGQMEVVMDGSRHKFTNEKGGFWRDLGRPEQRVLGVQYSPAGYNTYAPYEVRTPDHWLFSGTGVEAGAKIGVGNGYRDASGWELDQQGPASPANSVLLAKGMNPGGTGAEMSYYDHPGGGGIFAAGSLTFARALSGDSVLSGMIRNFFDRFLK